MITFQSTAEFWTNKFAKGPIQVNAGYQASVDKLKDMGVREEEAISVLSCNNWDLNRATVYIFS